jgi:hypothetical protein
MSQAITTTESVLLQSRGGHIKGKLSVDLGRFDLTAQRIVFYKWSYWYRMFGLIGMLLAMRSRGTVALELELGQISGLARGKYGINKKVLDVTVGGTTHRLTLDNYDAFAVAVRDAIAQRGRQVVQTGEEAWSIQ